MDKHRLRRQVDGVVKTVLLAHPEYLTRAGAKWLATSITKRLTGQLHSLSAKDKCPDRGHTGGKRLDPPRRPAGGLAPQQVHHKIAAMQEQHTVTDTKITPDEHSDVVGGSTAGRVIACPGSVKLNQAVKRAHKQRILNELIEVNGLAPGLELDNLPAAVAETVEAIYRDETTSSYAAEGTGLHEAMAWILDNDEEPESVTDRTFVGIIITPTLYSECIIPALQGFDDYCDKVLEEDGEELVFTVEERCQIPGIPNAFGTSDIVGKTSKRMVIWDWKFGAGKAVHPQENDQLRFYGRAAAFTKKDWFGFGKDGAPNDMRVDLVISQPRIGDGEPQVWTTTFDDLEKFRWRLVAAVAEAQGADPKVSQGPHCTWCEAKHVCPAKHQLGQRILARVDKAFDELPGDEEDVATAAALKAQEVQFTPDDLADWLKDADDMDDWIKWVRSLAYSELTAGRAVTGLELDQGLGNAAWTVDFATVDRRLASYGLTVEARREVKSISPTAARKLLKKDEKNAKLVEKIIERPPGGVKMVPTGTAKNPVKPVSEKIKALGDKLAAAGHEGAEE